MIPIQWTSNIANDTQAKKSFEELLVLNSTILKRLNDILLQRETELNNTLFSLSTPKDTKLSIIERIAEIRETRKLLTIG